MTTRDLGKTLLIGALLAAAAPAQGPNPPNIPGQNRNGMRVFLWGGLKTHGPGQHDYPQFLADWSKLLTEKGAVVNGALHAPSAADLENTDVVVVYKGDAGFMNETQKAAFDAFVKRGGGFVSLHDALCGPDPAQFSTYVGGAKKHGETNFTLEAPVPYTVVDKANPIMADMSDFTLSDEAFFSMTWAKDPGIHVLATAKMARHAERRRAQGRGRAANVDLRAHRLGRPAVARVRLDAGPHLRQFLELPDPADSPARHRLGGQEAGRRADHLCSSSAPPAAGRAAHARSVIAV